MHHRLRHCLLIIAGLSIFSVTGGAQTGGLTREQMWYAPTAADWAKPCQIIWQRTWDDALAVAKETGRPILICINMDGEIASEHYAGIRYRQPEIAKLYEPYVTVIASVYRHTPRDHDEQGRRIPCPRFGTVTCGEHITIEPILYEKFMEGVRVAPRHICVELDGQESYDVYYALDTDSVFKTVADGMANRDLPPPVVRGDRSIVERVASRDVHDRKAVEAAFDEGDRATRRALLEAALAQGDAAPMELLRRGVFGFDEQLSALARKGLAKTSKESAVELINEALRVPLADDEKEELVTALERIGKDSIQARTYASVQRGLSTRSETVDVEGWTKSMSGSQYPAAALDEATVAARLNRLGEIYSKEDDLKGRLELAEAFLASADQKNASGDFGVSRTMIDALYDDARNAALEAEKLGGKGWRVNAVLAAANWRLGDLDEAYRRAEMAVGDLPGNPDGETAMIALGLFAEHRSRQVWKAVRAKQDWPSKWVTDVNAAYAILAKHPFGTADQVVAHCDFLKAFGAAGQADRALDAGLARFPDSPELHERLRGRIFRDGGVDAIEGVYAKMIARDDAHPSLPWFAGYASLVVAEFHRRNGESDAARDAYDRAIVHFEDAIAKNSETQATSDHFIHIAHAGMARVALEKKEWSASLAQIIAAFERNPASSNIPDGLNITAVETAKMLLGALKTNGMDDLAQTLETAMQQLDPALLELRPFERPVGPPRGRDGRPRRQ